MQSNTGYPRNLSEFEVRLLRFLLPESKSVYDAYFQQLCEMMVVGVGRFGASNLILSSDPEDADFHSGLGKIFTSGVYIEGGNKFELTLHFAVGGVAEFDIIGTIAAEDDHSFAISYWNPDSSDIKSFGSIRKIAVEENQFTLAVSSALNNIWFHEHGSGFNRILPLTNFMNEVRFAAGLPGDLNSREIFARLDSISDNIIVRAFLSYNKLFKKITVDNTPQNTDVAKKNIFARLFTGKSK